ncbi:MAG: patatin-like phospholipase family protein [Psychroflexus sp.]|nr:patatin-like phospholipase family protein [Psychroflexus sp.]
MKKQLLNYYWLALLLFTLSGFAQQDSLKVGLVLSGGGAKGLAHIGVLKVIEEHNIKIDYIAGTSMGAIVGGLYASGYNTTQLDSIFRKTDFSRIIRDKISYQSRSFFSREFGNKYVVSLPFEDFKVEIPSGLSKGQNLYNLLKKLSLVANKDKFENMKIPFFCMATNLETAESVQLDSGSLALAMTASGAIPSIFKPMEVNGKLLSDGGITDNYPIERLRRKGMDKIIGVNVQDSLVGKEQLETGIEVITQINNFRTIKDMREKRPKTDVYIRPNIKLYDVLSFDKGKAIIQAGEIAALKQINKLKKLPKQDDKTTSGQIKMGRFRLGDIVLNGDFSFPRSYITGKLDLRKGQIVSLSEINQGINGLNATGNFRSIRYKLKNKNGVTDIIFSIQEEQKNQFLKFAVHYDDLYKGSVLTNLTKKTLFLENDMASLDVILGQNVRYNFNYYVDKGNFWSIGLQSRINRFEDNLSFEFIEENSTLAGFDLNEIRLDFNDFTNRFYLETFYKNKVNLKGGIEHKLVEASTRTVLANIDDDDENPETIIEEDHLLSIYAVLGFDSLDELQYPSSGFYFKGKFNFYFANLNGDISVEDFSIAKGAVGGYIPLHERFSLHLNSETGFRVGSENLTGLNFFLGGYGNKTINNFKPFYGYDFFTLSSDSFIKGLAELDYRFYKENHLILSANFANVEDDIFTTGEWFTTPDFSGYAIGYGCDTILGPVDVKYAYSPEVKDGLLYFSLGYRF